MTDTVATGEDSSTVFTARRVITMDPEWDAGPTATAVAVSGGRVTAVGGARGPPPPRHRR